MAVIGKNLVTQPRWVEVADESGWYGLPKLSGAILPAPVTWHDNGDTFRAYLTGKTYTSPLFRPIGNIEPGTYYLWVSYRDGASVNADPGWFGIVPIEPGTDRPLWETINYLSGEWEKFLKPLETPAPDYFEKAATIEIPDMGGWQYRDIYETYYLPAEHSNIEFAIVLLGAGTLNLMSVKACRLDEISKYDEPLTGYFDGSTQEADGVTFSWDGEAFNSTSSADDGTADTIVIAPPAAQFSEEPPQFMLPEATGVIWTVNGDMYEPGAYQVEPTKDGFTVSIVPVEKFGYTFDPPAEEQEYTWYAADPDPDPGPDENWEWPEEITPGGKLVARWLKWDTEKQQLECSLYYDTVRAYVWAYTRGNGFDDDMVPAMPLQRVIVSAAARLAYNPEYVSRWQVSQESEVMSVFNGFNLAEQAILNRYRRRWA